VVPSSTQFLPLNRTESVDFHRFNQRVFQQNRPISTFAGSGRCNTSIKSFGCKKKLAPVAEPPSADATKLSERTVVTGSKLGREIAVDLKPDADFNQNWRCPCHYGFILRLALPRYQPHI
jgi:hypothetical protein